MRSVSCLFLEGKEWAGGRRSWKNTDLLLMQTRFPCTDVGPVRGVDGGQPSVSHASAKIIKKNKTHN